MRFSIHKIKTAGRAQVEDIFWDSTTTKNLAVYCQNSKQQGLKTSI